MPPRLRLDETVFVLDVLFFGADFLGREFVFVISLLHLSNR